MFKSLQQEWNPNAQIRNEPLLVQEPVLARGEKCLACFLPTLARSWRPECEARQVGSSVRDFRQTAFALKPWPWRDLLCLSAPQGCCGVNVPGPFSRSSHGNKQDLESHTVRHMPVFLKVNLASVFVRANGTFRTTLLKAWQRMSKNFYKLW